MCPRCGASNPPVESIIALVRIIFTIGCNFRCPFCYIPQLVLPEKATAEIPQKYVFSYLEKNKQLVEGVAITDGEPTLYKDLPEFIQKLKDIGFFAAIETNGSNFKMLKQLIRSKLVTT